MKFPDGMHPGTQIPKFTQANVDAVQAANNLPVVRPEYEVRKIHNAKRQIAYHNKPDEFTGLFLNEMTGYAHESEILSAKPFTPPSLR